jgi:hypothetical protein
VTGVLIVKLKWDFAESKGWGSESFVERNTFSQVLEEREGVVKSIWQS